MLPPGATAADDPSTLTTLANAAGEHAALVQPGALGGRGGSAVVQAMREANVKSAQAALAADDQALASSAYPAGGAGGADFAAAGVPEPFAGQSLEAIGAQNRPAFSIEREGMDTSDGDAPASDGLAQALPMRAAITGPISDPDGDGDQDQPGVNDGDEDDRDADLAAHTPESLRATLGVPFDLEDDRTRRAFAVAYGGTFPLARAGATTEGDWVAWLASEFQRGHSAKQNILWRVERLRLARDDQQWVSSIAGGPWREPPKPRDAARVVDNMIRPAMEYREEIVAEQRPGWKTRPVNQDPESIRKAEAQQAAIDYQYDQQRFRLLMGEVAFWCSTDGCAFTESFWDSDRGPWDDVLVELGAAGPSADPRYMQTQLPMGDVNTVVHRIEEVVVSANATATRRPDFWIIRKQRTQAETAAHYGDDIGNQNTSLEQPDTRATQYGNTVLTSMTPNVDELKRAEPLVDEYTGYCERSALLPHGLMVKVVGTKVVVAPMPLRFRRVPLVRWTDGSKDPAFFPRPIAYGWLGNQTRINAVESKMVENIRLQSGAKLLAKKGVLSQETLTAGNMTIFEVRHGGTIDQAVKELTGTSIGQDAVWALTFFKKRFEEESGYTDAARGSVSPQESGRALLANREMLERIFAPLVNAFASSAAEWGEVQLHIMAYGFDEERFLAVEGQSRPDLARSVTAQDFDGIAQVMVDPETLMPLPRALRLFLLDDALSKGLMSPQEYRRRLPFGFVGNMETPDTDHYARAKRSCEFIRRTGLPSGPEMPVLWMDNVAIHQDVLERELILPDHLPPQLRSAAYERWMQLAAMAVAQGAMALQGGPAPQGPPPMPVAPPAGQGNPALANAGGGPATRGSAGAGRGPRMLPPGVQPNQATSPGVPASTAAAMAGGTNEQMAGRMADLTSRQP